MNYMIPQDTELGELEIVEVYAYYDMPLLFWAKGNGKDYLGYWNETFEDGYGWLYIQISMDTLQDLKDNTLSVGEVFRNPLKEKHVYLVETRAIGDSVRKADPDILTEDMFPLYDHYIEYVTKWE